MGFLNHSRIFLSADDPWITLILCSLTKQEVEHSDSRIICRWKKSQNDLRIMLKNFLYLNSWPVTKINYCLPLWLVLVKFMYLMVFKNNLVNCELFLTKFQKSKWWSWMELNSKIGLPRSPKNGRLDEDRRFMYRIN